MKFWRNILLLYRKIQTEYTAKLSVVPPRIELESKV